MLDMQRIIYCAGVLVAAILSSLVGAYNAYLGLVLLSVLLIIAVLIARKFSFGVLLTYVGPLIMFGSYLSIVLTESY